MPLGTSPSFAGRRQATSETQVYHATRRRQVRLPSAFKPTAPAGKAVAWGISKWRSRCKLQENRTSQVRSSRGVFPLEFKDHFSPQADRYIRFRPRYPRHLFAFLASLPARHERAWDCGTGNGQAAVALADYFREVVATDPSERQIEHAQPLVGVTYLVAPAERCPLADESVDLVTVAQAAHWFDLAAFYGEVRRVARAGGAIALWTYGLATISAEVDAVVWRLYADILGDFWPPERRLVEDRYAGLPFPFEEIEAPNFTMQARWNLDELLGYLSTWSSAQKYLQQHGTSAIEQIKGELTAAWGLPGESRSVVWPLYLRSGRVKS